MKKPIEYQNDLDLAATGFSQPVPGGSGHGGPHQPPGTGAPEGGAQREGEPGAREAPGEEGESLKEERRTKAEEDTLGKSSERTIASIFINGSIEQRQK